MSLFNSQTAKEASKTNVNYGCKRRDESRGYAMSVSFVFLLCSQ